MQRLNGLLHCRFQSLTRCPSENIVKSMHSMTPGLRKQKQQSNKYTTIFPCQKFTVLGQINECQETKSQFPIFPICRNHLFSLYLYFLACEMKVILFCHLRPDGEVSNEFGAQSILHYKFSMCFCYCFFRRKFKVFCLNKN